MSVAFFREVAKYTVQLYWVEVEGKLDFFWENEAFPHKYRSFACHVIILLYSHWAFSFSW